MGNNFILNERIIENHILNIGKIASSKRAIEKGYFEETHYPWKRIAIRNTKGTCKWVC